MQIETGTIVPLVLVGLGVLLILVGLFMSVADWNSSRSMLAPGGKDIGDALAGLAKVLDAIKNYPPGQKMIVFGIILIIIGGVWGGVSALPA